MKIFGFSDLYYKGKRFYPADLPENWQTSPYRNYDMPEKLKECKYLSKLPEVFYYWGDIYCTKNFKAWQNRLAAFDEAYHYFFDPDHPFFPYISYSHDLDRVITNELIVLDGFYSQEYGRPPTFEEVQKYFQNEEKIKHSEGYLYLYIPLDMPKNKIKKWCMEVIEKEKAEHDKSLWDKNEGVTKSTMLVPPLSREISEKEIEDWNRYLQVYTTLKKTRSWEKTIQIIDPDGKIHPRETEEQILNPRIWRKEKGKAEKIINGVGRNAFPVIVNE